MKNYNLTKLVLAALSVLTVATPLSAEDYLLDFTTKAASNNSYSNTGWTWPSAGVEWRLEYAANNNRSWDYVRFGGKEETNGVSQVKSLQPLPMAVRGLVLDVRALNEVAKSTAFKLFVAKDADFAEQIDVVSHAKGEGALTFLPKDVAVWPAEAYYKLEVYWKNTASSNKGIDINSLLFKESYAVIATVNDETLGSVSVEGVTLTAQLGECVTYDDPAWTVTEGEAAVSQEGDVFTVMPAGDCTVQINFKQVDAYTVWLDDGSGVLEGADELVQPACGQPVQLPVAKSPCPEWEFMGWSEVLQEGVTECPELIKPGEYIPQADQMLYAVYRKQEQGDGSMAQLEMLYPEAGDWDVSHAEDANIQKDSYYKLLEGGYILSPVLNLAGITKITAMMRTYYGTEHVLSVTDETNQPWGTIKAVDAGTLALARGVQQQELQGTGRLKFWCETATSGAGVGVSAITVSYRALPDQYHTYPTCEPGAGTGFGSSQEVSYLFYVEDGAVCFTAEDAQPVRIYDAVGCMVYDGTAIRGLNRVSLPRGMYVLQVGSKASRVTL